MKKFGLKQFFALLGLLAIVGMYGTSIVLAILAKPGAADMFIASVAATVIIPIVIYSFLMTLRLAKKRGEKQMKLTDLQKYNRRLKKGESPAELADEIEKKYQ